MLRNVHISGMSIGILPIACSKRTAYLDWRWYANLAIYDYSVAKNFGIHRNLLKIESLFFV
jgi:hypothetical protein